MSLQLKSGNRYGMSFANGFCNAHFTICIRQFKATNITAAASTAIEQKKKKLCAVSIRSSNSK